MEHAMLTRRFSARFSTKCSASCPQTCISLGSLGGRQTHHCSFRYVSRIIPAVGPKEPPITLIAAITRKSWTFMPACREFLLPLPYSSSDRSSKT